MTVSVEARPAPAKVTAVSNPRKHARAKATGVSDNRAAWSTGPGHGDRGWLRCPWAAAGPGRTTSRRAEPPISDRAPRVWRAPEGPEGTGGLRGDLPSHTSATRPTGVEGTGGSGGPGCGARGRWRGLAGLRDRPLRAAGSRVAISRAGRRPRAHQAARPRQRTQKRPPGTGWAYLSRLWESNPRPIHYE